MRAVSAIRRAASRPGGRRVCAARRSRLARVRHHRRARRGRLVARPDERRGDARARRSRRDRGRSPRCAWPSRSTSDIRAGPGSAGRAPRRRRARPGRGRSRPRRSRRPAAPSRAARRGARPAASSRTGIVETTGRMTTDTSARPSVSVAASPRPSDRLGAGSAGRPARGRVSGAVTRRPRQRLGHLQVRAARRASRRGRRA